MADNSTHAASGKGGMITGQVGLDTSAEIRIGVHGWRLKFKSPNHEVTKYGDSGATKFDGTMTYGVVDIACYMLADAMPQLANLGTQHTFNAFFDLGNTLGYTGTLTSENMEWTSPLNRGGHDMWIFGRVTGNFYGAITEDTSDA